MKNKVGDGTWKSKVGKGGEDGEDESVDYSPSTHSKKGGPG